MRIVTNEGHIRKYGRIGKVSIFVGLVLLTVGAYLQFFRVDNVFLSLALLIPGFLLSQIAFFLMNRYARNPRTDIAMNDALKGLDRQHTLYHYIAPSAHFLAGPAGMWILIPKTQRGRITFDKNRWRQRGDFMLAYLRIFAQEGIGRPDLDIGVEMDALKKFFRKELPEHTFPDPNPILVFTNPRAVLDAENAPVPTVSLEELKEVVRKQAKEKGGKLTPEQLSALTGVLEAGINSES